MQYYLWRGETEAGESVDIVAASEAEARERGELVAAIERRSKWPMPLPEDMGTRWERLRQTPEGIEEARRWVFDAVRLGWITWATLAQLVASIEQAAEAIERRIGATRKEINEDHQEGL